MELPICKKCLSQHLDIFKISDLAEVIQHACGQPFMPV